MLQRFSNISANFELFSYNFLPADVLWYCATLVELFEYALISSFTVNTSWYRPTINTRWHSSVSPVAWQCLHLWFWFRMHSPSLYCVKVTELSSLTMRLCQFVVHDPVCALFKTSSLGPIVVLVIVITIFTTHSVLYGWYI